RTDHQFRWLERIDKIENRLDVLFGVLDFRMELNAHHLIMASSRIFQIAHPRRKIMGASAPIAKLALERGKSLNIGNTGNRAAVCRLWITGTRKNRIPRKTRNERFNGRMNILVKMKGIDTKLVSFLFCLDGNSDKIPISLCHALITKTDRQNSHTR